MSIGIGIGIGLNLGIGASLQPTHPARLPLATLSEPREVLFPKTRKVIPNQRRMPALSPIFSASRPQISNLQKISPEIQRKKKKFQLTKIISALNKFSNKIIQFSKETSIIVSTIINPFFLLMPLLTTHLPLLILTA